MRRFKSYTKASIELLLISAVAIILSVQGCGTMKTTSMLDYNRKLLEIAKSKAPKGYEYNELGYTIRDSLLQEIVVFVFVKSYMKPPFYCSVGVNKNRASLLRDQDIQTFNTLLDDSLERIKSKADAVEVAKFFIRVSSLASNPSGQVFINSANDLMDNAHISENEFKAKYAKFLDLRKATALNSSFLVTLLSWRRINGDLLKWDFQIARTGRIIGAKNLVLVPHIGLVLPYE